jgi:hypothetical protein
MFGRTVTAALGALFAVVLLAGATVGAGEPCGNLGSVDCCTLGGVLETDLDANGNDIITDADGDSRWEHGTDDQTKLYLGSSQVLNLTASEADFDVEVALDNGVALKLNKFVRLSDNVTGFAYMAVRITQTPYSLMLAPETTSDCVVLHENSDSATDFGNDCTGLGGPAWVFQSNDETTPAKRGLVYHNGTDFMAVAATGAVKLSPEVEVAGVSGDGTGKAVCVKADGDLGTCTDAVGAGGTCTCN